MDVDGSCTDGDDDWGHYGTSYTAALLVKKDDGEYSIGGTNYKLELTSAPFTYPEGMEYGDIDTLKVIVTDPMAGEITLHVQADHVPAESKSDWIAIYKKDDLVEAFPTKNKWSPNPSVAGTFKNTYINGEVPSCALVGGNIPEDCEPAALKGKMVLSEYWPKSEAVMQVHALFDKTGDLPLRRGRHWRRAFAEVDVMPHAELQELRGRARRDQVLVREWEPQVRRAAPGAPFVLTRSRTTSTTGASATSAASTTTKCEAAAAATAR